LVKGEIGSLAAVGEPRHFGAKRGFGFRQPIGKEDGVFRGVQEVY
jgi:hypothetical protein